MEKDKVAIQTQIIVIGGSSGSLEVIMEVLPALPAGFRFPVVIVMHRNVSHESLLRELLEKRCALHVVEIEEKEPIRPATIYLVPADYHVLIEKQFSFSLDYSEKVNFSRPSIDVTFMSAVAVYGAGVMGILLSGANEDGAAGIRAIRQAGGYSIVQDPEEALVGYMPRQALLKTDVDAVMTARELTGFLAGL